MTGFGRAEGQDKTHALTVELRSVNHRYCDVVVRLPRLFSSLEEKIKKQVKARFARGRIEVSVASSGRSEVKNCLKLDLEAAASYVKQMTHLKDSLALSGEITVAMVSQFRGVLTFSETTEPLEALTKNLDKTFLRAMTSLEKMRKNEGKALSSDLRKRLQSVSKSLSVIKSREKGVLDTYHKRLQTRVADLSQGVKVDPLRLAQEVAIFAERSDISEERTRLAAHIDQFKLILRKDGGIGRSLDFLVQEMHREVNTISSKSSDQEISIQVLALKSELEKIKEQVQNIA